MYRGLGTPFSNVFSDCSVTEAFASGKAFVKKAARTRKAWHCQNSSFSRGGDFEAGARWMAVALSQEKVEFRRVTPSTGAGHVQTPSRCAIRATLLGRSSSTLCGTVRT